MIKKICITSVIVCIVTFLLFAFAWWNINPAMWSDGGRIGCASAMAILIVICIMALCISEGI
jgi:hypothetical protein